MLGNHDAVDDDDDDDDFDDDYEVMIESSEKKQKAGVCRVQRVHTVLYIVCTVQSIEVHHDACSKTFPQGR